MRRAFEGMLDAGILDAVLIATPLRFHFPMSLAAVEHGLAVFCEKAMCYSVDEAKRLAGLRGELEKLVFGNGGSSPNRGKFADQAKPIIFTLDDEVQVSDAVERDLRRHFGRDYRIIKSTAPIEALETV